MDIDKDVIGFVSVAPARGNRASSPFQGETVTPAMQVNAGADGLLGAAQRTVANWCGQRKDSLSEGS